jgi:hypothetical protein
MTLSFCRLLACKAEAGVNVSQFFTVIGLVAQLVGSFLLAARGFTAESFERVPLALRHWLITLLPAEITTGVLFIVGLVPLHWEHRWAWLFVISLFCSVGWVPALAKYALKFCDTPEQHLSHRQIERLNRSGMLLLIAGFILSAFGAVLT